MPKNKSFDYFDISETGNWNVAADYAKLKIMKHLYMLDDYVTMAKFGALETMDELTLDPQYLNQQKVVALKRLHHTLETLIQNTIFAVKKGDKSQLKEFAENLKKLKPALELAFDYIRDEKNKKRVININEQHFQKILDILIEIKEEINEPLNKADLIFTSSEELDPDELKERIAHRLIHGG